ncbi:MAG: hypothetical protein ACI8QC_004505 [Planctomycetota bacterium]|jgi:hypothetical protein
MILTFALAMPLLAQAPEPVVQANEVRAYDLRALRVHTASVDQKLWALAPQGLTSLDARDGYDADQGEQTELFFPGLISDLLGEQLSFQGRWIEVLDNGKLLMVAPEPVHAQAQRVYDFLRDAADERIELAVEVIDGAIMGPSQLSRADVRAILDRIPPDSVVSHSVSLASADWGRVESTVVSPIVLDYDVEIAQASVIADPIVMGVQSGIRIGMQAVPARGGVLLTTIVRHGELPSIGSSTLGMGLRLTGEDRMISQLPSARDVQTYEMAGFGSASSAFLPDGGGIMLRGVQDGHTRTIIVHHIGGGLSHRRELALSSNGEKLVLLAEHAAAPSQLHGMGSGLVRPLTRGHYREVLDNPLLGTNLGQGPGPEILDLITNQSRRDVNSIAQFGPWRAYSQAEGSAPGMLANLEAQVEASLGLTTALQLRLDLVIDGKSVAHVQQPMLDGYTSLLSLGNESLEVLDYDVEVAQFAATPDPHVSVIFDGIVAHLGASLGGDGRLRLDLRAAANWAAGSRRVELGTGLIDGFDQNTQGRLFVDERRVLSADAQGGWSASFGATGDRGASLRVSVSK